MKKKNYLDKGNLSTSKHKALDRLKLMIAYFQDIFVKKINQEILFSFSLGRENSMSQYVALGQSFLNTKNLGRSQLAFLVSVQQANKHQKSMGYTKRYLSSRANIIPQHFNRLSNWANDNLGGFEYDKQNKNVIVAPHLWDGQEQYIKVPLKLILGKVLDKQTLIYLLGLSLLQSYKKEAWRGCNLKLVEEINKAFEKRGWEVRLNLTMSYASLKTLKNLGLLDWKLVKRQVNDMKKSKRKYYISYYTQIKLTKAFYNLEWSINGLLEMVGKSTYHIETSVPKETSVKQEEKTEDNWEDIMNVLGDF